MTAENRDIARTRTVLIMSKEFPPGPGGIGTHAYKVASHLHQVGWNVSVVAEQQRACESEIEQFNAVQPFQVHRLHRVHFLPLGPFEGLYRMLIALRSIRKDRPQIIVASHAKLVWIACLVGLFVRRPVVAIGHGTEFQYPNPRKRAITKWSFSTATAVVNNSRFTESLMQSAEISAKRQAVVHPGVDANEFAISSLEDVEALRQQHGLRDAKIVLTVALISERKGQDIIIRALPEIRKRVPNAHYVIVGVPEEPSIGREYAELATELGVANVVHFIGRVPQSELPLYYHLCDVFALTSRRGSRGSVEGFGIVAAEAAVCGKPSVVADGSGLIEAIVPEVTGLVVPQESQQATAEAITRLLDDDELRSQMGRAAFEFALSSQSWNKRIVDYDRLLSELIQ